MYGFNWGCNDEGRVIALLNKCSGGDFLLSDLGVPVPELDMGSREREMS